MTRYAGLAIAAVVSLAVPVAAGAQVPPVTGPSGVVNLSGDWGQDNRPGRGGIGQSLSISVADPLGRMRGKEPDISYQPWALDQTLANVPPTGPDGHFEQTTDPNLHYCEPLGLSRIYTYPAKTRFLQTREAVYILHEVGPAFRVVWLNSKHPEDPDPQYWGHSIGWYEGTDTLVVDTVGVNDRSWLDQVGHVHSDQLHFVERYKRIGADVLEIDMTVDDPGAFTKPFAGHRNLLRSTTGFMRYQWACSVRDNYDHFEKVGSAGSPGATTFKSGVN